MPELNVTTLALFSFPEAMVLTWLSLSIIGVRPSFYQIFQIGLLQTLFAAFFFLVIAKLIVLPFGVHTLVQMIVNAWLICWAMKISYKSSWLAVTFGWTVYISTETLLLPLIFYFSGSSALIVNENNWLIALPYHYLILAINLIIIFLVYRFNVRLVVEEARDKKAMLLKLSSLLFVQTLLVLTMYCQYYPHQENKAFVELSFVMGNAVLPMITLIIIAIYLWDRPKKCYYKVYK